jgi:hypothetical protein
MYIIFILVSLYVIFITEKPTMLHLTLLLFIHYVFVLKLDNKNLNLKKIYYLRRKLA